MTRDERARSYLFRTAILACLVPGIAHAQSPEAESLFREGRRLIKAGKLEDGCDKLEASNKIEPSVGTLLNLGDCREKLGAFATAWGAFRQAEALAKLRGDARRRNEASRRALAVEPKINYMVIVASAPVTGLVVKRDGDVVDPATWSSPLPVDPDTYTIVAEAPGYKPWRTEVDVDHRRKRVVVTIPILERAPVVTAPRDRLGPTELPPPVAAAPPVIASPRRADPPDRSSWTTARKVALGAAIGGALAAGAGGYFGLRSRDLEDQSDELCPGPICDDAEGLRLNDRAQEAARRANVLFAVGGAALATGVVLWVIGSPGDGERVIAPSVGRDHVGASIGGRF